MSFIKSLSSTLWNLAVRASLFKLLFEAILIFGSVYFALILEADRNRDYERELFIEELELLKREISKDSSFFESSRFIDPSREMSIYSGIAKDSLVIKLIIEGETEKVLDYFLTNRLFGFIDLDVISEKPTFNNITSNFAHLIINKESFDYSISYFTNRRKIERLNAELYELNKRVEDYRISNYFIEDIYSNEQDKIDFINSKYFINSIIEHQRISTLILNTREIRFELFINTFIKEEIESQKQALKGIF